MISLVPLPWSWRSLAGVFFVLAAGTESWAQDASELDAPFSFSGPPAPPPPGVITRDDEGRATVRAVRLTAPLRVDGRLDEAIYGALPPIGDFIQQEPLEGPPATEKTEVWLLFDDEALYVSFRLWESRPDNLVANEMRRDSNNIFQNDHVAFLIDPFYDRRNGIEFAINPLGGRWDGQISNESAFSADWNPIWDVKVGRFDGGWTVETAIPFKSLRYRPGRAQIWGFNARRTNRTKNETSFLTRIPRAMGQTGLFRASLAATMVGLEVPQGSRNIEVKPYAVSSVQTDQTSVPRVRNDPSADIGVDVRYGLTQNLSADFTYNTDFAQVEADEQQVNLTRFSLFFPEKREFFLENQGVFGFGGQGANASGDTPVMFYSRRIGFDQGLAIPIEAGGRMTGRAGRYSMGMLNITSNDDRQVGLGRTNFSVARLRRDILAPEQHWCPCDQPVAGTWRARQQPGVRRRRHVCLLQQPDPQHVLGAHADSRRLDGGHELPRRHGLRRRPLRRRVGAPGCRRQLPARDRVRAARRYPKVAGAVSLQPSTGGRRARATLQLELIGNLHRELGWARGHAIAAIRALDRIPEQRCDPHRRHEHLRVPAGAAAYRRADRAGRRL